jgi:hypothetical protein
VAFCKGPKTQVALINIVQVYCYDDTRVMKAFPQILKVCFESYYFRSSVTGPLGCDVAAAMSTYLAAGTMSYRLYPTPFLSLFRYEHGNAVIHL